MIALLILVAIAALLIASALKFDAHCEKRFSVSIFEIEKFLVNVAAWAFVVAGCVAQINGHWLIAVGALIFSIQLIHLIIKTTIFHGITAFILLSLFTLGILALLVLAISAICHDRQQRRVIFID